MKCTAVWPQWSRGWVTAELINFESNSEPKLVDRNTLRGELVVVRKVFDVFVTWILVDWVSGMLSPKVPDLLQSVLFRTWDGKLVRAARR